MLFWKDVGNGILLDAHSRSNYTRVTDRCRVLFPRCKKSGRVSRKTVRWWRWWPQHRGWHLITAVKRLCGYRHSPSWTLEHFEFTRAIRAWNSLHNRREYASWEGLLPGSFSLVAKCIPVFVKVRRCIYSSREPHTTIITLSSIVVSDFLPLLVMTSLLEQALDWLTGREYPPKFRFFNSRIKRSICAASFARIAPQDCLSRLCIDLTYKSFARNASFASGVNAPLVIKYQNK